MTFTNLLFSRSKATLLAGCQYNNPLSSLEIMVRCESPRRRFATKIFSN